MGCAASRGRMRPLTVLVAVLVLAGCVAPLGDAPAPADVAAGDAWERVRALLADVPCEAAVVGKETSENLLPLANLAFPEESGSHGEMDVRGDLALVSRYSAGGFEVVDLADPADPKVLAVFELPETVALDVKWMPAGDAAVVGDRGKVHLVDLRDPANPVLAATFDEAAEGLRPYQSHMLHAWAAADGTEYVYVATQSGRAPMYVLERDGWTLAHAGQYAFSPVLASDPALGQHDMTVYHDEILGEPVLYVAEGALGWSAADLADPANPQRIGGTLSPEPGAGYTHTVRVEFLDGKRIVVTMQEVGQNSLKVYDATDLRAPVLLARWNADPARPHIPQHNIQLLDGMLYLAHYTEGVYVFDITGLVGGPPLAGSATMAPVAHWAVEEPDEPSALGFANVWDVVLSKGILYASDSSDGVTSIGFGCLAAGDPALTAGY